MEPDYSASDILYSAIQDLANFALDEDESDEDRTAAIELIESICRSRSNVWSPEEAKRFGIEQVG